MDSLEFLLFGLRVERCITRVSQYMNSDASSISSEVSVASRASHKRQSLTGYGGGLSNGKTTMGVASAHAAKNQRHAFQDRIVSVVAFAIPRHGDLANAEVCLRAVIVPFRRTP